MRPMKKPKTLFEITIHIITVKSDFSAKVEEIDIQQKVSKIVRTEIKEKRQQEKQKVKERQYYQPQITCAGNLVRIYMID